LAANIEQHPELVTDLEFSDDIRSVARKRKLASPPIDFDVFQVYANEGGEGLYERLASLDVTALKRIVALHGFDQSKLAEKWRSKPRLLNLILDRVAARNDKGRVFKDY
jgi:hypothetical protein